jgi:hypothetical protein
MYIQSDLLLSLVRVTFLLQRKFLNKSNSVPAVEDLNRTHLHLSPILTENKSQRIFLVLLLNISLASFLRNQTSYQHQMKKKDNNEKC